jgi:hypothetical protein
MDYVLLIKAINASLEAAIRLFGRTTGKSPAEVREELFNNGVQLVYTADEWNALHGYDKDGNKL